MSVTRRKRALYAEPAEGVFVPEFTVLGVSRRTAGRCQHDAEVGLSDVAVVGEIMPSRAMPPMSASCTLAPGGWYSETEACRD